MLDAWPRETHQRQRDLKLLNTSPFVHIIAPDSVQQRSIYLEQPARKGKPTLFEIQYTYQSMAQYFDLNNLKKPLIKRAHQAIKNILPSNILKSYSRKKLNI